MKTQTKKISRGAIVLAKSDSDFNIAGWTNACVVTAHLFANDGDYCSCLGAYNTSDSLEFGLRKAGISSGCAKDLANLAVFKYGLPRTLKDLFFEVTQSDTSFVDTSLTMRRIPESDGGGACIFDGEHQVSEICHTQEELFFCLCSQVFHLNLCDGPVARHLFKQGIALGLPFDEEEDVERLASRFSRKPDFSAGDISVQVIATTAILVVVCLVVGDRFLLSPIRAARQSVGRNITRWREFVDAFNYEEL